MASPFDWTPYRQGGALREDSFTGMDPAFNNALQQLFASAPPEVQEQLRIHSGYRSPEKQAELYEAATKKYGSPSAARKYVAPPGRSQHNHGNAADLTYLDDAAREWAHQNASEYGLTFPMSHEPWHIELEGARNVRPAEKPEDPLRDFGAEMRKSANTTGKLTARLLGLGVGDDALPEEDRRKQHEPSRVDRDPAVGMAGPLINRMNAPQFLRNPGAYADPAAKVKPPIASPYGPLRTVTERTGGEPSVAGGSAGDTVQPGPTRTAATNLPPAPAPVPSPNEGTGDEVPLSQRIAETIFPNAEDPKKNMGTLLQSLSVGLGQMSAGRPVDLSSVFNRVAQERQDIIDNEARAQQQAYQRKMGQAQLDISRGNMALGQARLAHDIAQDELELAAGDGGVGAAYQQIAADYPELAPLVKLAGTGDKSAQKELAAKLAENVGDAMQTPAEQVAFKNYMAAKTPQEKYEAVANLPENAQNRVLDAANKIGDATLDPAAIRIGQHLHKIDPAKYPTEASGIEGYTKMTSGMKPDDADPRTDAQIALDMKEGTAMGNSYREKAINAAKSNLALDQAERALTDITGTGAEAGGFGKPTVISIGKLLGAYAGTDIMRAFFEKAGIDPAAEQSLTNAQQQLIRAVTMNYSGQGSISDSERIAIAREALNADMVGETAYQYIERIRAINMFDIDDERYYRENAGADQAYNNYRQADGAIRDATDLKRYILSKTDAYATQVYISSLAPDDPVRLADDALYDTPEKRKLLDLTMFPTLNRNEAMRYRRSLPLAVDPSDNEVKHVYMDMETKEKIFISPNEGTGR